MWFTSSRWIWVRVSAKALLYSALIVATVFAVMYSVRLNQHENWENQKLRECCDRCKMTHEIKKCKRLQTDFYDLMKAHRLTWERHPVQALWDASGCRETLREWDKNNPDISN